MRRAGYFWAALAFVGLAVLLPKDDTDPPGFFARSGLGLYTDSLTGCQYVKAGYFGGTTPRLDAGGKPMCLGNK